MGVSAQVFANILFGTYLVSALMSGIVFKEQSNCVSVGRKYHHPFMQSFTMYIGEALCIFIFFAFIRLKKDSYEEGNRKALEDGKSHKIPLYLVAIPTACDFVSSTLAFFALSLMPVSLYSMIRSGNLVITAIASVIFLKRKLYLHHLVGLTIIMAGLVTVGLVVISNNDESDDQSRMVFGLILLFVSFFAHTAQLIVEEKFFSKFHLNPFYVVGVEGIWGIFISGLGMLIANYIPCPSSFSENECSPNGNLEDISFYFQQIFTMSGPDNDTPDQPMLLAMTILGIFVILAVNASSLSITKYVSSLARNVAQVLSPFFVWMASLIIGWQKFMYGQLIGFLIIAFGTCLFNEIITIPAFGLDTNTKKNLEKRKQQENLLKSNQSDLD